MLFQKIDIIPIAKYEDFMKEAESLISDEKDEPFLALALSEEVDGIWSDDSDFRKQTQIKIYTTKELVELLNENKS